MWRFFEWLGKVLNSPVMTLPWGDPGRHFEREFDDRPVLDDRAFYDAYYAGSGIPEVIPIGVRRVYADVFGRRWNAVRPDDRATDFMPDLDLADLLYRVGKTFGVTFSPEEMRAIDGSFDAIVRHVASHSPVAPLRPPDEDDHPGH